MTLFISLDPFETKVARDMMVDSQVRPNKVIDPRIISAMRQLPREAFLPAALAARAYADDDVALDYGRVMLSPMVMARLVQLCDVRRGERVLVVACGTGYGAALLDACGAEVTALEEDAALLGIARPALAALAPEVNIVEGLIVSGWPAAAPYDLVFIEGTVGELPPAIVAQVNRSGRLVMARGEAGLVGQAVIGRPSASGMSFIAAFDCTVAPLPMTRRAEGFVF